MEPKIFFPSASRQQTYVFMISFATSRVFGALILHPPPLRAGEGAVPAPLPLVRKKLA